MNQKILKVGITGGIGSGKTTVCSIFETLGIPIYYADIRAKRLMMENQALITGIKNLLGAESYSTDGQLDRARIAQIVFNDASKLQSLNALVHPAVRQDAENWHQQQIHAAYTLQEAALLFENGSYKGFDKIILVTAPTAIRLARVMRRDKVDEKSVLARMEKQLPESEKLKLADFVIPNDGNTDLIPHVMKIHEQLINLKNSHIL